MARHSGKRKTHFKGIRAHTQRLLQREDKHTEFKRSPGAIDDATIVSFANSSEGGWVLGGVEDDASIVGCDCADRTILAIQSRASTCKPPVELDVSVENAASKAILVVHIPPSGLAPHCTSSGRYVIRVNNQKEALDPQRLLAIFLERETKTFLARFNEASAGLVDATSNLEHLVSLVAYELGDIPDRVDGLLWKAKEEILSETATLQETTSALEQLVSGLQELVEVNLVARVDELDEKFELMLEKSGVNVALELRKRRLRSLLKFVAGGAEALNTELDKRERFLEEVRKRFESDFRDLPASVFDELWSRAFVR